MTGLGRIVFGASFALLGAFSLFLPGFGTAFHPLPHWIAWQDTLSVLVGVLMLVSGLALLVARLARPASLVLAGLVLLELLLVKFPHIAAHPLVEGVWQDMSESLAEFAGASTIFAMLLRRGHVATAALRTGQILFALALPAFGLSHFFYLNLTAPIIPSWLPLHVPLSYFTGAAHIAAGIGILFGVLPRPAATLEAIMVSLFTLLVWVPMLCAAPADRGDWSEICISAAISGAAWAVAESFRGRPWGFSRSGY